ncbi:putative porin [Litorilituus lipolyticus]|nr:putative porin [Litorilituus lipolyticus]
MKLSLIAAAITVLPIAFSSQANEAKSFQSFSSLGYYQAEYENVDSETFNINSQYYFEGRKTKGPLNEFDYINTLSNISVGYLYSSSDYVSNNQFYIGGYENRTPLSYKSSNENNLINVRGEWVVGGFVLGGSYSYQDSEYTDTFTIIEENRTHHRDSNSDSDSAYSLSLGYLISENFLIQSTYHETGELFTFRASYDLTLNDNDYIGFSYNTDEELDFHALSTKYFKSLENGSYLTVSAAYTFDNTDSDSIDVDDYWSIGSSYYFNKNTSISASYNENESYSLAATHFFNDNYSLSAGYASTNESNNDFKSYSLSFTAQF